MKLRSLSLFFILLFSSFQWISAQYTLPKKPNILYPVYDEVGLLSNAEKETLNNKLIKYSDSTSTQIEVIIIKSTKEEDINFLATRFGEEWGIGQKDIDNGVVFLIALEDRTMSIQQGRAVEQYLTASAAGQIIDYIVAPEFKKGNYFQGIDRGTDVIIEALQGKFKNLKPKKDNNEDGFSFVHFFLILIILILVFNVMNRNNRGGGGGFFDEDITISRRGRRGYSGGFFGGGSFGGGSSGGGFGGFGGGGSFGGGGASGGW